MDHNKRQYNKKSDYWGKFSKEDSADPRPANISVASFQPELAGEPFYVSSASAEGHSVSTAAYQRGSSTESQGVRRNRQAFKPTEDRYSSIRSGMLPYSYTTDGVSVRDAIELCQKAYANVSIFRNAIDVMSEFSNTEIYFDGGSKKSNDFFNAWLKKIKIYNLKDQFFREFYRGGNVFVYRIEGQFRADDFAKIVKEVGELSASSNKIPVRYVLLNPFDIVAKQGSTFSFGAYEKIFSQYELARLQTPTSQEDKDILDGLPDEVKSSIKKGGYGQQGLRIKLDPEKLIFSFYKKQDYEPFAIPFGFPVLEDINAKLELKKMDQAITRTIENVILLITMGAEPEKGGINPSNLAAMQRLFKNESVGRVLVSDYTTKAEFIIPDLNKVLGPEKYEILNEDIKQGLQNIIVGEEKYSATEVKAQIFVDRLKEGRNSFLNDFLIPEMERVAKGLGMKNHPTPKFRDIDIRDQTQLMRVTTRLMELGVITPQQGMDMFHTGQFPKADQIAPSQETFKKERKEGFYNPIVGGVPVIPPPKDPNAIKPVIGGPIGGPAGAKKKVTKNQTNKSAGRPQGTTGIPVSKGQISVAKIQKVVKLLEETRAHIVDELKVKFSTETLNKAQEEMVDSLCQGIAVSEGVESWKSTASSCVNNFEKIAQLSVMPNVLDIMVEHSLDDDFSAALLYHSQNLDGY